MSARRPSNPFTKNQDAPGYYDQHASADERAQLRSLAQHMRKLSMSNSALSDDSTDLPSFRNKNTASGSASNNGTLTPRAEAGPRPSQSGAASATAIPGALTPAGGAKYTPHSGDLADPDQAYGEDQDKATLLSGSLSRSSSALSNALGRSSRVRTQGLHTRRREKATTRRAFQRPRVSSARPRPAVRAIRMRLALLTSPCAPDAATGEEAASAAGRCCCAGEPVRLIRGSNDARRCCEGWWRERWESSREQQNLMDGVSNSVRKGSLCLCYK